MAAASDNKIVLIVRPTRLEDLVARFNTLQQAQFYVEHLGADFSDYLGEHNIYRHALAQAEQILSACGRLQKLDRKFLSNFVFGPDDLVVVLGQDGLVANTLKYLERQPVIGINPDPARWDGVLLPFGVSDLAKIVGEQLAGGRKVQEIAMAKASLNTGQSLYAVNDFFIGARSHVSARYSIALRDRRETQSSSGIIVSTGLGSTGWLRSVYAGWSAIASFLLPQLEIPALDSAFPWDADVLHFTIREPYPSRSTSAQLAMGRIDGGDVLQVVSNMPENGVVFSDGVEADFLEFNSGTEARIGVADKRGHLVL